MYLDGYILIILYAISSAALILGVYNNLEFREFLKELNKPKIKKTTRPPIVVKRAKGHWD